MTSRTIERVNWWQVLTDCHKKGYTFTEISTATGIPRATLAGYKNLQAEPKHLDGVALLDLWRRLMVPEVPTVPGDTRQGDRVRP